MHRPTSGHPSTTGAGDACVAPTVSSFASTNLEQNAGDPWVAPTISIPQTGVDARRTAGMRASRPKGEGQEALVKYPG